MYVCVQKTNKSSKEKNTAKTNKTQRNGTFSVRSNWFCIADAQRQIVVRTPYNTIVEWIFIFHPPFCSANERLWLLLFLYTNSILLLALSMISTHAPSKYKKKRKFFNGQNWLCLFFGGICFLYLWSRLCGELYMCVRVTCISFGHYVFNVTFISCERFYFILSSFLCCTSTANVLLHS